MDENIMKDLGMVTAYAYALSKGYTGTEDEFAELMASYAEVGQTAVDAALRAKASEEAAKASETASAASETAASTSASSASTSATNAAQDAQRAENAKNAAAAQASTAANQAIAATQSANTASTKATEASQSASSASESATAAQTAKTAAETAQEAAETAETNAKASETAASESATSASNSATTATTKASEAAQSATSAGTSATNAANSATVASESASTASTKASQASQSATNAENSATAAGTAKTDAEAAKTAAETAQTAAETAQGKAEDAQAAAEAAAQTLVIDPTLTQPNQAAEAKATGDAISLVKSHLDLLNDFVGRHDYGLLKSYTFTQITYVTESPLVVTDVGTGVTIKKSTTHIVACKFILDGITTPGNYILRLYFGSSNINSVTLGTSAGNETITLADHRAICEFNYTSGAVEILFSIPSTENTAFLLEVNAYIDTDLYALIQQLTSANSETVRSLEKLNELMNSVIEFTGRHDYGLLDDYTFTQTTFVTQSPITVTDTDNGVLMGKTGTYNTACYFSFPNVLPGKYLVTFETDSIYISSINILNGTGLVTTVQVTDGHASYVLDQTTVMRTFGIGLTIPSGERTQFNVAVNIIDYPSLNEKIKEFTSIPYIIGNTNTFFGNLAGINTIEDTSQEYIGEGQFNAGFGLQALGNNIYGDHNTAFGYMALKGNVGGDFNTGFGEDVLLSNQEGEMNTAMGTHALQNATNSANTAIGHDVGRFLTTGTGNVFIGRLAAQGIITGNRNVIIGAMAAYQNCDYSECIVIGNAVNPTDDNQIRIGDTSHESVILAGKIIHFNADGTVTWEAEAQT